MENIDLENLDNESLLELLASLEGMKDGLEELEDDFGEQTRE